MTITVFKVNLEEVFYLRNLFLQENNFQIRYNAVHERGWSDIYLVCAGDEKIGYGSLHENDHPGVRDTIFEFFILPHYRNLISKAFQQLILASNAVFIECQSNDLLLTSQLFEFGRNINADTILFGEGSATHLTVDNIEFRRRSENDIVFEHKAEPVGDFVVIQNNQIVATGGFLLHYNKPFADLYMEVREDSRRRGFGSYLIQEIKKQCYLVGRVPAARTGIDNIASRLTLIKAGLKISGFILKGEVKPQ